MATFNSFEEIDVWKRGSDLAVKVYKLTAIEKISRDFGLKDQLKRAAVSISSNIAEGFERNSNAEFRRFVLIAKGSCGELRSQLRLVKTLELMPPAQVDHLIQECLEISAMLQSLATYLTKSIKSLK